jgi:aminoglycoside phosphotransferase family enzyme/predicted kinase
VIIEAQSDVIDFLASPQAHGGTRVERIDTHISVVFLAARRAYKLKRAVRFDYVDFSTLERRRRFCDAEVRLNRRTAPGLYKGVVPVTRSPSGVLTIGGEGAVVDWLVEMERFDQDQLLDRLAAANRLDIDHMDRLALAIARFHDAAERRHDHGGADGIAWVVEGNAAGFAEFGASGLDQTLSARVTDDARTEIERHRAALDERRRAGRVRQCHGDLHLRNIVLLDGEPTLFDGVEFNDDISCSDVLYDLAFLLMDLWRRHLKRHANVVLNRYMTETSDLDGLRLLPLFLSCRAAVRAKTSATSAQVQQDPDRRRELQASAGEYLEMAGRFLKPLKPCVVAIGGFSGSGKSTVAKALAPGLGAPPGALVVRSDEIRKRLCGVPLLEKLGPEGYAPHISDRVYGSISDQARIALRAGHSVIADAVFGRPDQRAAIERVAAEESAPFLGCWLTASESVLVARATARREDPSDADAAVIRRQRAEVEEPRGWHRVDATGPRDAVVQACSELLRNGVASILTRQPGRL